MNTWSKYHTRVRQSCPPKESPTTINRLEKEVADETMWHINAYSAAANSQQKSSSKQHRIRLTVAEKRSFNRPALVHLASNISTIVLMWTLYVQILVAEGPKYVIQAGPTTTVAQFKTQIQGQCGIPSEELTVMLGITPLEHDEQSLEDSGVTDGANIFVVQRPDAASGYQRMERYGPSPLAKPLDARAHAAREAFAGWYRNRRDVEGGAAPARGGAPAGRGVGGGGARRLGGAQQPQGDPRRMAAQAAMRRLGMDDGEG